MTSPALAAKPSAVWRPRVFMSYARHDLPAVESLVQGMQKLQYPVWVDRNLTAGMSWWVEIIRQITECDVVIVALSPALLESEAARAEQAYALAVGKTLLPVMIVPVQTGALPRHLAGVQFVDYTEPTPTAGFELATALSGVRPAPPLPDPLPPAPDPPGTYELADRIQAANLTLDEQFSILASIKVLLSRPRERAVGLELLEKLRQRDLYHAVVQQMAELDVTDPPDPKTSAPADPAVAAPGWYRDPSGRHQLRWFDGDWTPYASDFGVVVDDPDF